MAAIHFRRPSTPLGEIDIESVHLDSTLQQIPSNHYLPPPVLRRGLGSYSEVEIERLLDDLAEIGRRKFQDVMEHKEIILTASGPMGGASTLLEQVLNGKECPDGTLDVDSSWVYIDPLKDCLPRMQNTYITDRGEGSSEAEASEHWRKGAEFLSEFFLALCLKKGYAVADGWTMGSSHSKMALDQIKNHYGYSATLVHVSCNEAVRNMSWQSRGVCRWEEEEFHAKNEEFYALLGYFVGTMDKILFCYRNEKNETKWAAKLENKELIIYDRRAFHEIKKLHSVDLWESAVGPINDPDC